jgi:hypothetical protein
MLFYQSLWMSGRLLQGKLCRETDSSMLESGLGGPKNMNPNKDGCRTKKGNSTEGVTI